MDLSFKNSIPPKKGRFLLAEPFLQEEHFHRSVVFLCEHNEEGTFGFVLNKYLEVLPPELVEHFPNKNLNVCIGGPVDENNVFYIHQYGDIIENCFAIQDDLFIGGNYEQIKESVNSGEISTDKIVFFLGYSGWSKNQLQNEIDEKAWLVAQSKNPDKHIFSKKENQWKELLAEQGRRYEIMSKFPDNHLWN